MARTTEERLKIIGYMFEEIPSSCHYWADIEHAKEDNAYHLTETEYDGEDARHTLTRPQFAKAVGQWARECPHPDPYQDRAATNVKRSKWHLMDYDAATIDQVVQWALFGEITYS